MPPKKILLVHLFSNGDCLYATVIARQIKEIDYPGCHITWAVARSAKQVIEENPYIDTIELVDVANSLIYPAWEKMKEGYESRKRAGEFDEIFYTQIIGENALRFDGGIRSSIYNNYPHAIKVPHTPILQLTENELNRVARFAEKEQLARYKSIILMECGPQSFSSALNIKSAGALAYQLVIDFPDIAIILSSNQHIQASNSRVIDGSILSYRENAALSQYCTLFVGCSSGISWLCTSNIAKPLPKVILSDEKSEYASSMEYDHTYIGLPTDQIIEIQEGDDAIKKLKECISMVLEKSFPEAKNKYHRRFKRKNYRFVYTIARNRFEWKDWKGPLQLPKWVFKRNGFKLSVLFYLLKAYCKLPIYIFRKRKC